jgi:hypothetical protein
VLALGQVAFEEQKDEEARRARGQRAPDPDEQAALKKATAAEDLERKRLENLILDHCNWHDAEWEALERRFERRLK